MNEVLILLIYNKRKLTRLKTIVLINTLLRIIHKVITKIIWNFIHEGESIPEEQMRYEKTIHNGLNFKIIINYGYISKKRYCNQPTVI